jgi:hypothetical protein
MNKPMKLPVCTVIIYCCLNPICPNSLKGHPGYWKDFISPSDTGTRLLTSLGRRFCRMACVRITHLPFHRLINMARLSALFLLLLTALAAVSTSAFAPTPAFSRTVGMYIQYKELEETY